MTLHRAVRSWSHKDKYNFIGLSQSNLRVQYRGHGKTHKDASSVRATHAIPASCGIYYFEVTIVSKGRDGYMGVGLSAQGVNMNRWECIARLGKGGWRWGATTGNC